MGRLDVGFLLLDVGAGLCVRCLRIVIILLADQAVLAQRFIALRLQLRDRQRCLGVGELRPGAVVGRLVERVVDLIEGLAGLDDAAFDEQARL